MAKRHGEGDSNPKGSKHNCLDSHEGGRQAPREGTGAGRGRPGGGYGCGDQQGGGKLQRARPAKRPSPLRVDQAMRHRRQLHDSPPAGRSPGTNPSSGHSTHKKGGSPPRSVASSGGGHGGNSKEQRRGDQGEGSGGGSQDPSGPNQDGGKEADLHEAQKELNCQAGRHLSSLLSIKGETRSILRNVVLRLTCSETYSHEPVGPDRNQKILDILERDLRPVDTGYHREVRVRKELRAQLDNLQRQYPDWNGPPTWSESRRTIEDLDHQLNRLAHIKSLYHPGNSHRDGSIHSHLQALMPPELHRVINYQAHGLSQVKTRLATTQEQLCQAMGELENAQLLAAETEEQLSRAKQQASEAQKQATRAEEQLLNAQRPAAEAMERATKAEERAQEAREQAAKAESRAAKAQAQAAEARKQASESEKVRARAAAQAAELQEKLNSAGPTCDEYADMVVGRWTAVMEEVLAENRGLTAQLQEERKHSAALAQELRRCAATAGVTPSPSSSSDILVLMGDIQQRHLPPVPPESGSQPPFSRPNSTEPSEGGAQQAHGVTNAHIDTPGAASPPSQI